MFDTGSSIPPQSMVTGAPPQAEEAPPQVDPTQIPGISTTTNDVPQDNPGVKEGEDFAKNLVIKMKQMGISDQNTLEKSIIGQELSKAEKTEVPKSMLGALTMQHDILAGEDLDNLTSEQLLKKAQEAKNDIEKEKYTLRAKLKDNPDGETLSRPQAVAVGLISILPYLVGAALKGKQGLGIGAQASYLGSKVLLDNISQDQKEKKALDYAQLESLQKQSDSLQKTEMNIAEGQIKRKEGMQDFVTKEGIKKALGTDAASGAAATSKALTAELKAMQAETKKQIIPVPTILKAQLGDAAPAYMVDDALKRIADTNKASPQVKEDTIKSIGGINAALKLSQDMSEKWDKLGGTMASRGVGANIPILPTKAKAWAAEMAINGRAIAENIEKDSRFSDEDAKWWSDKLWSASDSAQIKAAKKAAIDNVLLTMKSAKLSALAQGGRDVVKFVRAAPVIKSNLPAVSDQAGVGDLISYFDDSGQVKVIQKTAENEFHLIN